MIEADNLILQDPAHMTRQRVIPPYYLKIRVDLTALLIAGNVDVVHTDLGWGI